MNKLSKEQLHTLHETYRTRLLDDCIPFWIKHGVDSKCGGLMTCLDRQGHVIDTDKGVWLQGRFAWMLGHLHNTLEKKNEWAVHAAHTLSLIHI